MVEVDLFDYGKGLVEKEDMYALHTIFADMRVTYQDFVDNIDRDHSFLRKTVMGDKSWCLQYDPAMNWQSTEWVNLGRR